MAEKKVSASFDTLMQQLRDKKFAPVYLLMGDEPYYIDKLSNFFQNQILSPEQQAFDLTVVFGADVNAAQIADLAMQYPMMSERKVIIVKEAQGLKSFDKLEKYVLHPQPKTILVFCYKNGTINRRLKFAAAVEKTGVIYESKKLKEWQLPKFILDYAKRQKASIDEKSAAMIADHIGADISRLTSELDKLLISLPQDNRRITPEIVEKNVGVSKDFNAFELRDAIVNKNIYKANQIISYFNNNPKAGSAYSLVPLLFNYFQNLMLAYYAPNRNDQYALAEYLGMRSPWGVKDYITGLKNYTGRKTLQILDKLGEIDAKIKGLDNPNTPSEELMRELIFFILH
jgi:DNA polymerase-3 subunit delta